LDKIISLDKAAEKVKSGSRVMIGGFLACGSPEKIIDKLIEKDVKELTIIANDTGFPEEGIGKLVVNGSVSKVIASHIGTNPETGNKMNNGTMEVELVPQGTLAERVRIGGAGLGGFLTPTGVGTVVEEGKEKINIEGNDYLLELPINADIALVKAWKADKKGNLVYRKSARNFNPLIAKACELVIVEAEEIVEVGQLDPDHVMTSGIFVDYIARGDK
jgi:acetate CoA/acetoacetate CoA-transferase alpha subunit